MSVPLLMDIPHCLHQLLGKVPDQPLVEMLPRLLNKFLQIPTLYELAEEAKLFLHNLNAEVLNDPLMTQTINTLFKTLALRHLDRLNEHHSPFHRPIPIREIAAFLLFIIIGPFQKLLVRNLVERDGLE